MINWSVKGLNAFHSPRRGQAYSNTAFKMPIRCTLNEEFASMETECTLSHFTQQKAVGEVKVIWLEHCLFLHLFVTFRSFLTFECAYGDLGVGGMWGFLLISTNQLLEANREGRRHDGMERQDLAGTFAFRKVAQQEAVSAEPLTLFTALWNC